MALQRAGRQPQGVLHQLLGLKALPHPGHPRVALLHGHDLLDVLDVGPQRGQLRQQLRLLGRQVPGQLLQIARQLPPPGVLGEKGRQIPLVLPQQRRRPGHARRLGVAHLLGHQGAGDVDAVEHVAHVVQHAGGHLRHARQARGLQQPAVGLRQPGLGLLHGRDVLGDAEGADDLPGLAPQGHLRGQRPRFPPVLPDFLLDFGDQRPAGADDFLLVIERGPRVLRIKEIKVAFSNEFPGTDSKKGRTALCCIG